MALKLKAPPSASKSKGESSAPPKASPPPPDNPKRHAGSMPTSLSAAPIGMSEERKAMYEDHQRFVAEGGDTPQPGSENEKPEDTDAPPEEEATVPDTEKPEPEAEEEKTEDEDDSSPEEGDTKDKKTMVPHAALHAERQSHKETKSQVKTLVEDANRIRQQLEVVLSENARLKQEPKKELLPLDEDKPIDDIETYVKDLHKEILSVKADNDRLKEARLEDLKQTHSTKLQRALQMVDDDLAKEGFPGFVRFKALVSEKIGELAQGSQSKFAELDNPEGWSETYRKYVYPEVASLFVKKAKEDKKGAKELLKEQANLGTGGGGPPAKPKDDKAKPWGMGDYFKMRQDNRPS